MRVLNLEPAGRAEYSIGAASLASIGYARQDWRQQNNETSSHSFVFMHQLKSCCLKPAFSALLLLDIALSLKASVSVASSSLFLPASFFRTMSAGSSPAATAAIPLFEAGKVGYNLVQRLSLAPLFDPDKPSWNSPSIWTDSDLRAKLHASQPFSPSTPSPSEDILQSFFQLNSRALRSSSASRLWSNSE